MISPVTHHTVDNSVCDRFSPCPFLAPPTVPASPPGPPTRRRWPSRQLALRGFPRPASAWPASAGPSSLACRPRPLPLPRQRPRLWEQAVHLEAKERRGGGIARDFLAGGCGCRCFPQTHPTSGKQRHPVRFSRDTNKMYSESMYTKIKKKVQTEQWTASERSALGQTQGESERLFHLVGRQSSPTNPVVTAADGSCRTSAIVRRRRR